MDIRRCAAFLTVGDSPNELPIIRQTVLFPSTANFSRRAENSSEESSFPSMHMAITALPEGIAVRIAFASFSSAFSISFSDGLSGSRASASSVILILL